jgi:two-component system, response regulator PdtaR
MRILVLDADLIATQLVVNLVDAGHEVLGPATSLEETMALAVVERPQLALLDIDKHRTIVQPLDELGIPTMFLLGCKAVGEQREVPRGLLSEPESMNFLLALVEYSEQKAGACLNPSWYARCRAMNNMSPTVSHLLGCNEAIRRAGLVRN